jgi:hypothetical protein
MGFGRTLDQLEVRLNVPFFQICWRWWSVWIRKFDPSGSSIAPVRVLLLTGNLLVLGIT